MLNGMDLFSGIGGITLALSKWVRPICYCENEPYAQSVLKSRFQDGSLPAAPIWDDVRTLDGRPFEGLVDIIYGGFPCQDLSVAGKGEGLEGKRSGLFFEIMRLAKEIKPSFIFLENVPAIRTRGLGTVCEELAGLRYDCRWGTLSAYDVGAPHKRDRWFLLAHANSNGLPTSKIRQGAKESDDRDKTRQKRSTKSERRQETFGLRESYTVWNGVGGENVANSMRKRTQVSIKGKQPAEQLPRSESKDRQTIANFWETQPDVCRVVDELPARMDRIKCLGNAVVPAQVSEAFERLIGVK